MAGLLGDSIDDPRTMAVFAGIQGLLSGRGLAQGISSGLLNYGGQMQQAKQQAAIEEERKQRAAMQAFQMQQQQMMLEQAKQSQAKQAAIESAYRGAIRSPDQMAMGANGGPTIAAANAAPNAAPGIDQQALIRGLSQADPMAAFQMLQPKQKEISRIEQMKSPDGKGLVNVAIYKDGSHQVMPYGVKPEMMMQDLGGKLVAVDKNALPNGTSFDKTMTPDAVASNKLGWANNSLGRERLNMDRSQIDRPQFNADVGGFISRPTAQNPNGQITPLAGFTPKNNMTEDQAKATGWLAQARFARKNMLDAMSSTPDAAKPGLFTDGIAAIPSFGLGEAAANNLRGADRQKFIQAASSFSEATLRAATGAGVNKEEAAQKIKELTPVFGDSDAVIKQKMAAQDMYLKSLEVRAGPGLKRADSIIPAPGAQPGGLKFLGFEGQ